MHRDTEVDLFAAAPFDFEEVHSRCSRLEVAPGIVASFVALPDLIDMKRKAGRTQDLVDIERLQSLGRAPEGGRPS